MQKNLFNCEEIGQAILAAAKNNEHFLATKRKEEEKIVEENNENKINTEEEFLLEVNNDDGENTSNFLHRLHQNSQLISPSKTNEDLTNKKENPINKVFESSQNNEEKNKTKKIIKLKLTKKFIKKIGQLFDEEEENDEEEKENELLNNEIEIPLWLCEMFYKAIHFGVSIPNEKIIEGEEEVIPTKNQKKKLVPTNNNALIKLSALTTLYEVFPDVPPKTIKHFAKENGYNFELTANCLLNISESFDAKLDLISTKEQLEEQQNSINIIVPSKNPNIIIPYGAPPPNKKDENGGKFGDLSPSLNLNDSFQTISQLLEQLDFERRHCLSMANQVRGKPHGGALCGHYMRRAGTLRQEQLRLTYQNDRLNAWNCPNDCFIDLHGMNWKRAVEFVKYKIDLCRETMPNLRKLHVITGYGSTSGHLSVIRQKLQKFLSNNGIDFCISPQNQGVVEIRLQGIRQRLSGVD
uniref:Uncharacterized protein n=1 Tax=Meloidogyne enterolobii TaxID=390850 RepID=A0A6V7UGG6_MELEN|nr:unnamed protein product [Meloidogyne enterolobii]